MDRCALLAGFAVLAVVAELSLRSCRKTQNLSM
jgi:hypothetical protein